MTIALSLLAVLVVASGAVVWNYGRNHYWWGVSDAQAVLLADPMAARDLDGLKLVRAEDDATVGFLGKSSGPRVSRWFTIRVDGEKTVGELGQYAESHGWVGNDLKIRPLNWVGDRQTSHGMASLIITADESNVSDSGERMYGTVGVFITE